MTAPMRVVNQRLSRPEATIMPSEAEPRPPSNPTVRRYCHSSVAEPAST